MKNQKEKLFEAADYDDVWYTIEIQVCKNGNRFMVRSGSRDTYGVQEVIGVLEMIKMSFIQKQSEHNRKEAAKKNKQPKKQSAVWENIRERADVYKAIQNAGSHGRTKVILKNRVLHHDFIKELTNLHCTVGWSESEQTTTISWED